MTFDEKIDHILIIVGAVVPLLSAISSLLNHIIRLKTAKGEEVGKGLLAAGSAMNFAAVNVDKAVQFANMARGKSSPQTGVIATPSAPAVEPGSTGPVPTEPATPPEPPKAQ